MTYNNLSLKVTHLINVVFTHNGSFGELKIVATNVDIQRIAQITTLIFY